MPRPNKKHDVEREFAESVYPIFSVTPKGVRRKWEGLIDYEKLRAERDAQPSCSRPSTPTRPTSPPLFLPSLPPVTPPRKKKPEDSMFTPKKPLPSSSPLKSPTARTRVTPSPYKPKEKYTVIDGQKVSIGRIKGPADGIVGRMVLQNAICPPGWKWENIRTYPVEDNVMFAIHEHVGCGITTPDAVSRDPINLSTWTIVVGFQWKGYEAYEPYFARLRVPEYRNDPFGARRIILKHVNTSFMKFKNDVEQRRRKGEDVTKPEVDVLAFGHNDIRVISLEKRAEGFYQVMFTYPYRPKGPGCC